MPDGRINIDTKIDNKNAKEGFDELQQQLKKTSKEFQQAKQALAPYRQAIQKAEEDMLKFAKSTDSFTGSNREFMEQVQKLGKAHKEATDKMLKANDALKQSFIEQAGRYMNATTHAEKLHDMYEQINPQLARLTSGALKGAEALQRFANSGSAAQLALEALGPQATAKELEAFTKTLNQNLGAVPVLALAAAAAFTVLTAAIAKAAAGPKPAEVYAEQAKLMAKYSEEVQKRAEEIKSAWGLFEKATKKATNPAELIANLRSQLDAMRNWSVNLALLAARGVDEGLIQELREMGPKAFNEIAALNQMTDEGLKEYQQIWWEITQLAYSEAEKGLIRLKEETDKQIKALAESLTPLGLALEEFKATWAEALGPFVEVWGYIYAAVVKAATAIGEFFVMLNNIHPIFSIVIFSILYMATAIFLLLIPLGILGNTMMGLRALAFYFLKPMQAIISLFFSIGATALIVSAALGIVAAAIWYLWNNNETFKNGVLAAWAAIAAAAQATWTWLYTNIIGPVMTAIWGFVKDILTQLRVFWQQNGEDILKATGRIFSAVWKDISTILGFILALFRGVFPIISAVVSTAWNIFKALAQMALGVFMNVVKMIAALINGDFSGAMRALGNIVRSIINGAVQVMGSFVSGVVNILGNLAAACYDGLAKIAGRFSEAGGKFMQSLADGIRNGIKHVMGAMDDITNKIRNFLPFSPAKEGPLKMLDKLDFGGPISWSIDKARPEVTASMRHLFSVPQLSQLAGALGAAAGTSAGVTLNQNVNFNNVENEAAFRRKLAQANRALALDLQSI